MALSLASNLAWEGDGPLALPVLLPVLIQEASNNAGPPAAPGAKICWAVEGAQGGAPAKVRKRAHLAAASDCRTEAVQLSGLLGWCA